MRYRVFGFAALVVCVVCSGTTHAAESLCCTHETYICFSVSTPLECGINAAGVQSCNECIAPGSSGSAEPLTVAKVPGSRIRLSWAASCISSDADYAVYEGLLGDFMSHTPAVCTTQGMLQATLTPADGDRYFVVVPLGLENEGSYGSDSGGTPRPASTLACLPQLVGLCPSP